MCWIGDNVKQIADEDIPIFKICIIKDSVIKSFYRNFEYKLGIEYTSKIITKDSFWFWLNGIKEINKGLHSYHSEVSIKELFSGITLHGLNGKHMNVYYEIWEPIAKVIGYIPKGSVYYLNDAGEYVSDKLVLTKIVNICD